MVFGASASAVSCANSFPRYFPFFFCWVAEGVALGKAPAIDKLKKTAPS